MTAVTDEDQGNDSGTRKADGRWDDGLIARRAAAAATRGTAEPVPRAPADDEPDPQVEAYAPADGPLPTRLDALRELVGLSRARLDRDTLAEAGRVLDEAAARQRLSSRHRSSPWRAPPAAASRPCSTRWPGPRSPTPDCAAPPPPSPSRAAGPTGPPGCWTAWPSPAGCAAGRTPGPPPPTRRCRGSSWSTCPTTTRPPPSTAHRWTGSWPWWTR